MSPHRAERPHAAHPSLVRCTVLGNIPVFAHPEPAQKVIELWRLMQEERRIHVFGYLLLDDRAELLASADDLPREVRRFLDAASEAVLRLLESSESRGLLRNLKRFQNPAASGADRFWQRDPAIEPVLSREAMLAALERLHRAPVQRGYVDDPALYRYSSARNYAGQPGLIPVTTEW